MGDESEETRSEGDNGFEWLEQKAKEELGELHSYTDSRFYSHDHGWDTEASERTPAWLIWDPNEKYLNQEEVPYEIQVARTLEKNGCFQDWSPFEQTSSYEERFVLQRYYGGIPPHPDSKIPETVVGLCSRLQLQMPDPDPVKVLPTVEVMRNLARERLDGHAEDLTSEVMRPLKKILIPCAIEATKALTDSRPLYEVEDDVIETWSETVRDLDHLWEHGIGGGISFDIIDEHGNWYDRTFQHVPDPVAKGAQTALKVYVEQSEDTTRDMSRDGILDRACPVYLKWEAARRIIWSILYDWTLEEAADKEVTPPPDIFSGRRTLPDHAADIVKKYKATPSSLPDNMEPFKENWVPGSEEVEGYSKAQMLVNAVGEEGLTERYDDPESFCELLESLLERHYEEKEKSEPAF